MVLLSFFKLLVVHTVVDYAAFDVHRIYADCFCHSAEQVREPRTDRSRSPEYIVQCHSRYVNAVVARIEVGTRQKQGEEAEEYRKVTQLARAPISVAGRPRTGFDLEWTFDIDDDGALEVKKVYCVRQLASAAGITLSGPQMTDVTGAQETVYAKILTNPLNPENTSTVEVVKDATGFTSRDNFVTWLRLYGMAYDAVNSDYRAQSLANIQVYR